MKLILIMADAINYQIIDLSSWITLYIKIYFLLHTEHSVFLMYRPASLCSIGKYWRWLLDLSEKHKRNMWDKNKSLQCFTWRRIWVTAALKDWPNLRAVNALPAVKYLEVGAIFKDLQELILHFKYLSTTAKLLRNKVKLILYVQKCYQHYKPHKSVSISWLTELKNVVKFIVLRQFSSLSQILFSRWRSLVSPP